MVGGFQLLLSTDVKRFGLLIRYLGVVDMIGGLLLIGIDRHAGMPPYWTALEGPPIVLYGLLIIYLAGTKPSSDRE